MKITHCKLKKKVQKELLRFFVLEVTARSAADILGIHPNSAALFYRGFIHYRINHSKEFADRQNHINGIENFWNQAKRVLRK
ncbi:hypothetical protein BC456_06010 [Neisseria meningitidis]|nr:hypothetical protein BC456_06010 [Neisseria meningitidis]